MLQTAAGACQTARSNFRPHCSYVWVSDELLRTTFSRFAATCTPRCKRNVSNVPGPLEARKRLARRRMNHLSVGRETGLPPPPPPSAWDLGWLSGAWEGDREPNWRWQPPDSPYKLAPESAKAPLPAWLTQDTSPAPLEEPWSQPIAGPQISSGADTSAQVTEDSRLKHPQRPPKTTVVHRPRVKPYFGARRGDNSTFASMRLPNTALSPAVAATDTADDIFATLEMLAFACQPRTIDRRLQEAHLKKLLETTPSRVARTRLHHVTTLLRLDSTLEQIGQYRAARMLDTWLCAIKSSKHRVVFPEILAHAAEAVRLRDLPATFAHSSYDEVSRALLSHWTPENESIDLVGSQRDVTMSKIDAWERYGQLEFTDDPMQTYAQLRSGSSQTDLDPDSTHLEPLLDAVISLIKADKPYRTCLNDILEFLLQTDQCADFALFVRALNLKYYIPIPRPVLKRWVMAYSSTQTQLALSVYRMSKIPLHQMPGFITNIIKNPPLHPGIPHGLLIRAASRDRLSPEQRGDNHFCRLSPSVINVAHEMVWAFATASRFQSGTRRANVYKLYRWLSARRTPLGPAFSRALVLTSFILPVFEDKPISSSAAAFAIRAIQRMDASNPENGSHLQALHDARLHPAYRMVHVTKWLEREYGPDWKSKVNPTVAAQHWERSRIDWSEGDGS